MLIRRLRYWLASARREAALRAEMEQHLDEKAAELRDEGLTESSARVEARRRFGNFGITQEESRQVWIARYWSEFWQDLRFGARTLIAQPRFTLPTVLALVLGIGVNAIVFNVYNGLALAPWAIRDAQHTVQVFSQRSPSQWIGFSWPNFRYLHTHTQSLVGLAAFSGIGLRVTRGDSSWIAEVSAASENYFDLIGTGFAVGRGFSGESAAEVVLHHDVWTSRFGADPGIAGQWLDMSGQRLQVVGVAAAGFNGPTLQTTDMWIPRAWRDILNPGQSTLENPRACCVNVVGRMKPGVSRAAAQAELNALNSQYLESLKLDRARVFLAPPTFLANPGRNRSVSMVFRAVAAAALLILLLACANVANLQLARAMARRKEMTLRVSLGASRGRILRQLMTEALLLSSVAGAASVAISSGAAEWIVRLLFGSSENIAIRFSNDARVLAFILLATLAATTLFALAPALKMRSMSSILLGAQVALCAILLSGTALLVRALERVRHLDTGFRYEQVIVMSTGLDSSGASDDQARGVLRALVERIGGLPGVESVAWASTIPYADSYGVSVADPRTRGRVGFGFNEVSANFFDTLGIPLLSGRSFTTADESTMNSVIVNEAAAQRLWPGESPLGKTLQILPTTLMERKDFMRPLEVIGVVRDFGARGLGSEREPYACLASKAARRSRLLIRHTGEAGTLAPELPKRARELDRRFLASAAPYRETIANALRSADISATIASVLGALCLMLACVGIYGVAAYNVSRRTREVGLRLALGAEPRAILALVLRQNLRTVAIGAALGITGALGFGRLLTGLLYGVSPADPVALLASIAILAATSALAAWGPARRASRIHPAITLRHE